MMMNNAAANTSSFFRQFYIVFGFVYELRSLARRRPSGIPQVEEEEEEAGVVVVVDEDDLEAGPPEAVEETQNVQNSVFEKAISILPPFPASYLRITLLCLFALLQIRWQLPLLAFPSSTLHKWYNFCVFSLVIELVASIAQRIFSAENGPLRAKDFETDTSHSATTSMCMPNFGTLVMVIGFVWNENPCALQL